LNSSSEEEEQKSDHEEEFLQINAPLDVDFLETLGEGPAQTAAKAHDLHPEVASRWNHLSKNGLDTEQMGKLIQNYKVPENCNFAAPKLNPELLASLNETSSKIDRAYMDIQMQVASGMTAIGEGITVAINKLQITDPDTLKLLLKACGDAGRLFADLQHRVTKLRRDLIKPKLNPSIRPAAEESQVDEFLFGSDFQSRIKLAKDLDKVASELKPKSTPKATKKTTIPKRKISTGNNRPATSNRKVSLNSYGPLRSSYNRPSGHRNSSRGRRTNQRQ
jgi:hypothetical protein